MSEKDLAEELESCQHHQIHMARPGANATSAVAGAWGRKDDNKIGLRSRAGVGVAAGVAHSEYVPPPLPPVTVTQPLSPRASRSLSPYADDAMITLQPDTVPLHGSHLQAKTGSSSRPPRRPSVPAVGESRSPTRDDDEPSLLHLGSSLTVEGSGLPQDRFSISSFFSTLALDPEPRSSPFADVPATSGFFSSEEFIIPAPVARKVPAAAPVTTSSAVIPTSTTNAATVAPLVVAPKASVPSSSQSQVTRRELRQEDIKVATCFAHDLGFEIINPSPATSPQMRNRSPSSARAPRQI